MKDRMLSDEVLLALIKKNGGGGTSDYSQLTNKPEINGVTLSGDKSASDLSLASLDANGKVPAAQLPSYVDDVINGYLYEGHFYEDSEHQTEITGESGKIYIDLETNKTYRWSGLAFVEISESLALGETASTAYAGDKGKANADAINAIKDGKTIDSFGDVESALADKVDKVAGKGLSTNDYTDADKAIVGGVTAALAGKQNVLTEGNNIKIDNNTISVNRWAVPAGKVVYTVITSDENYGQNVHVQRHTLGGALIDDRTFFCEMYKTTTIDDLISIYNPYSEYRITLLKNSDEQQAGYMYVVSPISKATSTSFTFMMEQEENDNDLIIREELDAVSSAVSAIKDGQTIDSFADVETALAGKQATLTFDDVPTNGSNNPVKSDGIYDALATKADLTDLAPAFSTSTAYTVGQYVSYDGNIYKCTSAHSAGAWAAGDFTLVAVASELETKQNATDNNLETTSKTVVGAVNELKSGLTNVDVALSVPDGTGKNVLRLTLAGLKASNPSGTWSDNVYTIDGLTFTFNVNSAGYITSIIITGSNTSESNTNFVLVSNNTKDIYKLLDNKSLVCNGCPANGNANTYNIYGWHITKDGSSIRDTGEGSTFEGINSATWNLVISIGANYTIPSGGLTFYPMIRPATITDPTFAPYIPSVDARLEAVESVAPTTIISVTADGVKTYAEILESMRPYSTLNCTLTVDNDVYQQMGVKKFANISITSNSGNIRIITIQMASNANKAFQTEIKSDGTSTVTEITQTVPTSGMVFSLIKYF